MGAAPVEYGEPQSNPLNYALFPAQPMNQPAARVAPASERTWASIKLISASQEADIDQLFLESLRLWLTLGGIGSRSRRGAGAVAARKLEEARKLGLPSSVRELEGFLRQYCKAQAVPEALQGIFCLALTRRVYLGPPQTSGEEAQKKALAVLRKARQDRPHPKNNEWGRSRWPEADAIRLKSDPGRKWNHDPVAANAAQYPRAALGLPIVIHFKDRPPSEPADNQVLAALPDKMKWRKLERYSSPVLVRPVRVWEGERVLYVPVVIFTDCTLPAEARPLVTANPKDEAKSADVIASYEIARHADETLRRVEKAFDDDPEFRPL
jgi:CRISPR-associated protein Cmr1